MSETAARFDVGGVISKTFAVIGRHFVAFFTMSLILGGLPGLIPSAAVLLFGQVDDSSNFAGVSIAAIVIQLVATPLLQGALTHATITDLGGQRVAAGTSLAAGFRLFLPLLGIGLLVGLGVGLGMILLIVPGILLFCRWAVVAPAAVAERAGVLGSMSRSSELTQGSRWAIFGLLVAYAVALILVGLVQYGVQGVVGEASAAAVVVTVVASTLSSLLSSTGIAAAYVELRRIKEGAAPEALASIFD